MGLIDSVKGRWSHRTGFRLRSPFREPRKFATRYLDKCWTLCEFENVRKMLANHTEQVIQSGDKKGLLLDVEKFVDEFIKEMDHIFDAQQGATAFLKKKINNIHEAKDKIDRMLKNMGEGKEQLEQELKKQWDAIFSQIKTAIEKNIKLTKDLAFNRSQLITMNWGFDLEQKRRFGFFYQREKEDLKQEKTDLKRIKKDIGTVIKHPDNNKISEDFKIYLEHIQKDMALFNQEVKDLVTLSISIEKIEAKVFNEFLTKLNTLSLPEEYLNQIKNAFAKINQHITEVQKVEWQASKADLAEAQV